MKCRSLEITSVAGIGNTAALGGNNSVGDRIFVSDWVVATENGAAGLSELVTLTIEAFTYNDQRSWPTNLNNRYAQVYLDVEMGSGGANQYVTVDSRVGTQLTIPCGQVRVRARMIVNEAFNVDRIAIYLRIAAGVAAGSRGGQYSPTFTTEAIQLTGEEQVIPIPNYASRVLIFSSSSEAYGGNSSYELLTGPAETDQVLNATYLLFDPDQGSGNGFPIPGVARYLGLTYRGEGEAPLVRACFNLNL